MKNRAIVNQTSLLILIASVLSLASCEKSTEEENANNPTENKINDSSKSSTNFYFTFETLSGINIRPEAGTEKIFFDCNQNWSVSYSGNISGFEVTPSNGNGKGSVTITFSEAQYKESSGRIEWNESGELTFYIFEGNNEHYRLTTKSFIIIRYGSKMKV